MISELMKIKEDMKELKSRTIQVKHFRPPAKEGHVIIVSGTVFYVFDKKDEVWKEVILTRVHDNPKIVTPSQSYVEKLFEESIMDQISDALKIGKIESQMEGGNTRVIEFYALSSMPLQMRAKEEEDKEEFPSIKIRKIEQCNFCRCYGVDCKGLISTNKVDINHKCVDYKGEE